MVNEAALSTLLVWNKDLPIAQTDVERTIISRVIKRAIKLAGRECSEQAPEVVDKWNELADLAKKVGIHLDKM